MSTSSGVDVLVMIALLDELEALGAVDGALVIASIGDGSVRFGSDRHHVGRRDGTDRDGNASDRPPRRHKPRGAQLDQGNPPARGRRSRRHGRRTTLDSLSPHP